MGIIANALSKFSATSKKDELAKLDSAILSGDASAITKLVTTLKLDVEVVEEIDAALSKIAELRKPFAGLDRVKLKGEVVRLNEVCGKLPHVSDIRLKFLAGYENISAGEASKWYEKKLALAAAENAVNNEKRQEYFASAHLFSSMMTAEDVARQMVANLPHNAEVRKLAEEGEKLNTERVNSRKWTVIDGLATSLRVNP